MSHPKESNSLGSSNPGRPLEEGKKRSGGPREALRSLYRELEGRIEDLAPICEASGRCCRFREYGHHLYVSDLELDLFEEIEGPIRIEGEPDRVERHESGICPFQVDGLCSVRSGRPIGCRVYFCDERTARRIEELAEEFHGRVRQIHDSYGIAYSYGPWLEGLASRDGRGIREG